MTIGTPTSYQQTSGFVFDSSRATSPTPSSTRPRTTPPRSTAAAGEDGVLGTEDDTGELVTSPGLDGEFGTADDKEVFFIPNQRARRRPVGAVQLLDDLLRPVLRPRPRPGRQGRQRHHLHSAAARRSALRRGRPHQLHGADARHQPAGGRHPRHRRRRHEHTNTTSPFVDQNQTYSSHPSHQVFLRAVRAERRRPAGRDRQADHRTWRRRQGGMADDVAAACGARRRRATSSAST